VHLQCSDVLPQETSLSLKPSNLNALLIIQHYNNGHIKSALHASLLLTDKNSANGYTKEVIKSMAGVAVSLALICHVLAA